jgi:predicted Rossmann-fold nucleotide-binding protein
MKISIFGGTNNKSYTEQERIDCEKLGAYLGKNRDEVLTGGCGGYPYFVGAAAVKSGAARVWGYSPATTRDEHVNKFGYPMDGVTDMLYKGDKTVTNAESLLKRMQDMVPFAPIAVALGGSWGTYYEMILGFWYKKTMILIEGFGGAVEAFLNTYDFFGRRDINPDVHYGPIIIRVRDIDEAIIEIEKFRKAN